MAFAHTLSSGVQPVDENFTFTSVSGNASGAPVALTRISLMVSQSDPALQPQQQQPVSFRFMEASLAARGASSLQGPRQALVKALMHSGSCAMQGQPVIHIHTPRRQAAGTAMRRRPGPSTGSMDAKPCTGRQSGWASCHR